VSLGGFGTDEPRNQDKLCGTHGWQDGRAWHHDYKTGRKVWSPRLGTSLACRAGCGREASEATGYCEACDVIVSRMIDESHEAAIRRDREEDGDGIS
jgi:hypothetical protein